MTFRVPEKYRLTRGAMGTDARFGNNGVFQFAAAPGRAFLNVIASDEIGWELVSVSNPARCPTWEEMCWIKAQFWGPDDCVVQYHPPASEYVNDHPYCLHLWRPTEGALPMPPSWMVAPRSRRPAMPTERRSPWFNARRDPPVNGGDDAQYEHRCKWINRNRPQRTDREDVMLAGRMCPDCQWRGLLREDGGKA